jgi:hypothetical protein
MNEIYLTKLETPAKDRASLIIQLDEIFKDEQLVMSPASWDTRYYPIKSIQHFIENSPSYQSNIEDLIVFFIPRNECLCIKNTRTAKLFYIRLARKEYLQHFPYIYEGKLNNPETYIIPIKFT